MVRRNCLRCLVSVGLVLVLAAWGAAKPNKGSKHGGAGKPPTGHPGTSPHPGKTPGGHPGTSPHPGKTPGGHPGTPMVPNAAVQVNAIGGVLAELFQIHAGLVQPKADYGGHRVKAINEVIGAMSALQKEMATLNKQAAAAYKIPPPGKAPPGARHVERQPGSDALMQQALKGLAVVHQQVQQQLPGKSQAQILKHLQSAVKELQMGLMTK